jgi:hypothetical protein
MSDQNGKALTAQAILKAEDLPKRRVEIPEWGGHVFVRELTGTERDEYEQRFVNVATGERRPNVPNMRAWLVTMCAIDDKGKRLFVNAQVDAVGSKSAGVLTRLFEVAADLNGLSDDSVEAESKKS